MDKDLRSIQEARELLLEAEAAQIKFERASQSQVDAIVEAMAAAGEAAAVKLGRLACEETGFGKPESKADKNRFSTRILADRMRGMKTVGIIRKCEEDRVWEIAAPMGVVAGLVPSTNPTSTAMYKAIIAAKARCGIVLSPHPRAAECTRLALQTVAEAAYRAGAPKGLFGCMSTVTIAGTNELMEHEAAKVILATGGTPMVRVAYSKGKPAYGVGSGNVPVYVDRSADVRKAAADVVYGASFDWGTLCSTERSIVVDAPVRKAFREYLVAEGAHILSTEEIPLLRNVVSLDGSLNTEQVGKSPATIARMAGFHVAESTRALVAEVEKIGREEPLSMETLSPILSMYVADGWREGCEKCVSILKYGGIGHTLSIHASNDSVIEAFALEKPAMRIVVNTVAALGAVGFTNRLFPAMTLGPGTVGGSITGDNISPLHLINVKRLAFETAPINPSSSGRAAKVKPGSATAARQEEGQWTKRIEERLRARAGNPVVAMPKSRETAAEVDKGTLGEDEVEALIREFRHKS